MTGMDPGRVEVAPLVSSSVGLLCAGHQPATRRRSTSPGVTWELSEPQFPHLSRGGYTNGNLTNSTQCGNILTIIERTNRRDLSPERHPRLSLEVTAQAGEEKMVVWSMALGKTGSPD